MMLPNLIERERGLKMKAAILYGKEDLRIEEVPECSPKHGEIKIKTAFLGICGSDVHEYYHCPHSTRLRGDEHPLTGQALPTILGHEWSGTIAEVGEGVESRFKPGTRMKIILPGSQSYLVESVVAVLRTIGNYVKKDPSLDASGAAATFVCVSEKNVHILPDSVPLDVAAMIEPCSVAWHATNRSNLKPGQSAIVIGSGPIGALVIRCLKARGAGWVGVSEPNPTRAAIGKVCGADAVYNPMQDDVVSLVKKAHNGVGVDLAFDCAGNQRTFDCAMDCTRALGTIVNVALWSNRATIDLQQLLWNERTLTASSCFNSQDMAEVIEALAKGELQLGDLISGRIPLDNMLDKGIRALATEDKHVKILIDMEASNDILTL